MTSKQKNMILFSGILVLLMIVAAVFVMAVNSHPMVSFHVDVQHTDGSVASFDISSDRGSLADCLLAEELIGGHDTEYGLYVDTADGETVSEANNQAWIFTRDGATVNTGISATFPADGERYTFSVINW